MKAVTLKSRVTILLTTFSILTISIFIVIQLTHEVKLVRKFKETQAQIVSLAIGNTWDKIMTLSQEPEKRMELLKKKITALKDSQTINSAEVLNPKGEVIFSTQEWRQAQKGSYEDLSAIRKLSQPGAEESESAIDKASQTFSLYIPLKGENELQFLVKASFSLAVLQAALRGVYQPAIIVGILLVMVNLVLGVFLSRLVVNPIGIFNEAAKKIASGRLDLRVNILTGDELQELGETFNFMTEELIRMKDKAENANPLTKLPGNIVIMEEVTKRIKAGKKFTVIYCDLDNFKAFNDKYGIHKGDEAIMMTGNIFKEAVKANGASDDFIGHEGGDDFLLVTIPERTQAIADYITSEFDKKVRVLYSKEDLDRGHIVAHARDGSVKEFPIMAISLAGVTNAHR
ncbi:MAG: diguanylate cyclase, partial [Candidatus Omnitrophica bacterium]|nr:diguanylate cyclase [Candidatus Omnitrophota bacterium]